MNTYHSFAKLVSLKEFPPLLPELYELPKMEGKELKIYSL